MSEPARSLWAALTPPGPDTPALAGEVEADVAIVGAGFLGLSTALAAAEAGASVVVLEAEEPGFGASGRNTGFIVPSLRTEVGLQQVSSAHGARGERLLAFVDRAGTVVFDLVARHGIDCAAERTGWLQPAHTDAFVREQAVRAEAAARRGKRVELLDATATEAMVGVPGYKGALLDPTGGQINPLAYARGLARAALAAGVRIFSGSPAQTLTGGRRWTIATPGGTVRAEKVLLATNALTDRLHPAFARTFIPVRGHQIATEPLSEAVQRTILPRRTPLADTRRHTFAARWSPDGRLVGGGLVPPGPRRLDMARHIFTARLARHFPMLGRVRADFVWSGVIAVTVDSMPRILGLAPGLEAAIGCNGRGVAMTSALGQALGPYLAGRATADDLPLPVTAPRPVPAGPLARHAPSLWLPWSTLRDRLDVRRG